jgi:hypothetical protein
MKRRAIQELPEIPILQIFEQKLASFLWGSNWKKIGSETKSRETLKVVRPKVAKNQPHIVVGLIVV